MRSPSAWLVVKEFRELFRSRAYWLLLLMMGPLAGNSFITAVNLYAEASGVGGGPAALSQGLSPLDGILVPFFGAYDIAVTLLFPFVVIRLVAAEKENGALKLMLQGPASLGSILSAKIFVLVAGWTLAWTPGWIGLLLWKAYGGSIYAPELLNLLLGHFLRVLLSTGVAVAAAALAVNASSAAIVTLGFTVGTWVLDFVAPGRVSYTPTAALRTFEQGQLRLSMILVQLTITGACLALAAVWLPPGRTTKARTWGTAGVLLAASLLVLLGTQARPAWDLSENRRNSFAPAAEAALRQIRAPLHVTVYLAQEDPRLMDLDRGFLSKLERVLPSVEIRNAAQSRSGLFESPGDHYGEVWYEMAGRKAMSRSTIEPVLVEMLCQLADVPVPVNSEDTPFAGHPLPVRPVGAAWLFQGLWPGAVALAWWLHFRIGR